MDISHLIQSALAPVFLLSGVGVTLGVMTLRKGHWVMFILGFFVFIFWIIGAIIPPVRPAGAL